MNMFESSFDTSVGDLAVQVEIRQGTPVVLASGFCTSAELQTRIGGARLAAFPGSVAESIAGVAPDHPAMVAIAFEVAAYFAGDFAALTRVAIHQVGSPFRTRAWQALQGIPAGETRTYQQLAMAAGSERAIRAAGSACASNQLAPFVPCHRVVRSDGNLGGYAFGLEVKRSLLDLETTEVRNLLI